MAASSCLLPAGWCLEPLAGGPGCHLLLAGCWRCNCSLLLLLLPLFPAAAAAAAAVVAAAAAAVDAAAAAAVAVACCLADHC